MNKKCIAKFKTDGHGCWSKVSQDVSIIEIEKYQKELRVYFDPTEWDVGEKGLIYTDQLFLAMLKDYLKADGKSYWNMVGYSEQGMQGEDYVSLDILR